MNAERNNHPCTFPHVQAHFRSLILSNEVCKEAQLGAWLMFLIEANRDCGEVSNDYVVVHLYLFLFIYLYLCGMSFLPCG